MESLPHRVPSHGVLVPQRRPRTGRPLSVRVHPRAVVDSRAELGADVRVAAGAVIGPDVRLGARVTVGENAVLSGDLVVGDDVQIWPCAVLGTEPQDAKFDGAPSRVVIGRGTRVREGVTVHRATQPGGTTVVGEGVLLMATCHVAHDCTVEDGAILANGALLAGHVHVGRRAIVSGNAVVHQFVRIGALAMIGGASRVNRDVLPFALLVGDSRLRGLNKVGLVRAGVDREEREELTELYRLLRARPNPLQALPELRAVASRPRGRELVAFLEGATRRGFCRF